MNPKPTRQLSELRFVRLCGSNVDWLAGGLSAIDAEVEGLHRSADHWRWRYLDAPGGGACIAAVRGQRVIGKFGVIARAARVGRRDVRAGLMEGLAVLPDARDWECYRGLLAEASRAAAEAGVELGLSFVIGDAADFNRRLGGMDLGPMPVAATVLSVPRLLRARGLPAAAASAGTLLAPLVGARRVRGRGDLAWEAIDRFDGESAELVAAELAGRPAALLRDADWLNWRYVDCPDRTYLRLAARSAGRLEAVVVVEPKPATGRAYVLELAARAGRPDTLAAVAGRCLDALQAEGIFLAVASFPPASPQRRALERAGFRASLGRRRPVRLFASPLSDPPPGPLPPTAAWAITTGDCVT